MPIQGQLTDLRKPDVVHGPYIASFQGNVRPAKHPNVAREHLLSW